MPPFNLSQLNNQVRLAAARALNGATKLVAPKGSGKSFGVGLDSDFGWNTMAGGSMGGLLGPAGGAQSNLALTRFRSTGEFIGAYTAEDTVHACAQLRAETVASLKWKLRHRRTGVIIEPDSEEAGVSSAGNHPLFRDQREWRKYCELVDLLKQPNPYQTWFEFQALQQVYYDLAGNSLTLKDNPNGLGWPEHLWPLNPAWTMPVVDTTDGLLGYNYQSGTAQVTAEPGYIIHVKEVNPASFFWGLSKIMVLASVLDAQLGIDEYQRGFFANGAVLSGVIQGEGDIDPKQFKLLKSEIKEQFQGVRNHFKVALLTGGMKWQNVSLSQVDMGMVDWKKLGADRVRSVYRVPKSKLGMQDDAQYNKLDAADRAFYKEAITPLAEMWQGKWTNELTCFYGYDFIFDVPQFDDVTAQLENAKTIDGLTAMTLWEKRKSMKKACPHLVFEDDADSPYNSNGSNQSIVTAANEGDKKPAMHLIFNAQGEPIAQLSAGKLIEEK
jgi:HK97 family phage portal protein